MSSLNERLPKTEVLKEGSVTHAGQKYPIVFKWDFEGLTVEQVCAIAAKDLVTDIQNVTRTNGGDSVERGEAKARRRQEMINEQTEKGFVEMKAGAKTRMVTVRAMTTEEAEKAVVNDANFAEKMLAALKAAGKI